MNSILSYSAALLFLWNGLTAQLDKPDHLSEEMWQQVQNYLLEADHPAKLFLDRIFESQRAIASVKALKEAGFKHTSPRRYTRVIVASHPDLEGFLFKMYTDKQSFHKRRPEWQTWLSRIRGALLIKKYGKRKQWDWFEVPKKWIYLIPHPEWAAGEKRKDTLLVVEKKELLSERKNAEAWQDKKLSKDLLKNLYVMVTALGLRDCAKPANAPFTVGGKIAFIDTEVYGEWPIEYQKLTKALSRNRKGTWKKLQKLRVQKLTLQELGKE